MCHELIKSVIMFAVEVQFAIMLFDELEGLAQLVFGKTCLDVREI